jgi:hypothetical protein
VQKHDFSLCGKLSHGIAKEDIPAFWKRTIKSHDWLIIPTSDLHLEISGDSIFWNTTSRKVLAAKFFLGLAKREFRKMGRIIFITGTTSWVVGRSRLTHIDVSHTVQTRADFISFWQTTWAQEPISGTRRSIFVAIIWKTKLNWIKVTDNQAHLEI